MKLKKWKRIFLCALLSIMLFANTAYAVTINVNVYGPENSPNEDTLQGKTKIKVDTPNGGRQFNAPSGQLSFEWDENLTDEVTITAIQSNTSNEYTNSIPKTVTFSETKTIDINLTYPTVTGSVYAPNGLDLSDEPFNIEVEIKKDDLYCNYNTAYFVNTEGMATYKIGGLIIGDYRLKVSYFGDKEYTDSNYKYFEVTTLGETIKDFNMRLTEPTIKGSIIKPDGTSFEPSSLSDKVYLYSDQGSLDYTTKIKEDGTYRFGPIPDGIYVIRTNLSILIERDYTNSLKQEIEIKNGEPVVLDLNLTEFFMNGKVVTKNSVPIESARVFISDNQGDQLDATTKSDGSFAFPSLGDGEYFLRASVYDVGVWTSAKYPFRISDGKITEFNGINYNEDTEIQIVCKPPQLILRAFLPDGEMIKTEDYTVTIKTPNYSTIRAKNEYSISGLSDGTWELQLFPSDELSTQVVYSTKYKIVVSDGVITTINGELYNGDVYSISLRDIPEPQFTATVRSENGEPLGIGTVRVYDSNNRILKKVNVSPDGTFSVGVSDDGSYRISVELESDDYMPNSLLSFVISNMQLTHFNEQEYNGASIDITMKSVQFKLRIFTPLGVQITNTSPHYAYPMYENYGTAFNWSYRNGAFRVSMLKDGEHKFYASYSGSLYAPSINTTIGVDNGCVVTVDGQPYGGEIIDLHLTQPIAYGILKTPESTGINGRITVTGDSDNFIYYLFPENDGSFSIGRLESGTYYLKGETQGRNYVRSKNTEIIVNENTLTSVGGQPYNGENPLTLNLMEPQLRCRAAIPENTTVSMISLSVKDMQGNIHYQSTFSIVTDDNLIIGGLENGEYLVHITPMVSNKNLSADDISIKVENGAVTEVDGVQYDDNEVYVFALQECVEEAPEPEEETPTPVEDDTNTGEDDKNDSPGTPNVSSPQPAPVLPTPVVTPTASPTPIPFQKLTQEEEGMAVQEMTSQLNESTKNLTGKNAADTLNNIQNAIGSIANAIVGSGKAQSQENQKALNDSVCDAIDNIINASETLNSDDDLKALGNSLNQIISSTFDLIHDQNDSSGDKSISELIKNVVSSMGNTISKVKDNSTAVDMVKDIISSSAPLIEKIDAGPGEKSIIDNIKTLMDSVIERTGKQTLKGVKTSETTVASITGAQLDELINQMDTVAAVAEELRNSLQACGIDEKLETRVLIDIPVNESEKNIRAELPEDLMAAVDSKGIERIEIAAGGTRISVPQNFVENMYSQSLVLEVKKEGISNGLMAKMTEEQKQILEYNSTIFNFNAIVGDTPVTNFQEPVCIKMKYELKENENRDQITILYLADDGTVQNMTGKYNEETGEVIFTTSHFSDYVIKNLIKSFTDVPESFWGIQYINSMASKGIIDGVGNGIFLPNNTITRAEFTKMLTVAASLYTGSATNNFTDVTENEWYYKYVSSAYEAGLTEGIYHSEFGPKEKITRQEMVPMIANAIPYGAISEEEIEQILSHFKDEALLDDYARRGMALAIKAEIVFGKPGDLLDPAGLSTRAEAAAMIYRYFNY
ncbi:MAG: S-layer homology domain-containing protein [Ruminiclostridium sp.]|nr:S-layer homology domain-containing protein [Ruminiclostridium sp.]